MVLSLGLSLCSVFSFPHIKSYKWLRLCNSLLLGWLRSGKTQVSYTWLNNFSQSQALPRTECSRHKCLLFPSSCQGARGKFLPTFTVGHSRAPGGKIQESVQASLKLGLLKVFNSLARNTEPLVICQLQFKVSLWILATAVGFCSM